MRRTFILMCAWGFIAAQLEAGTITGVVRAQGKPGTDVEAPAGKYDGRQFKFVERIDYASIHDFLVYVDGPVGTNASVPAQAVQVVTRKIAQKGAMFSPHILPIVVGTTVEWPNYD